jgi:hypothetical protein
MVRALTLRGNELTEQIRVRLDAFHAQELDPRLPEIEGFEMLRGL